MEEQSQETTFDFDSAQRKADASLEEFNGINRNKLRYNLKYENIYQFCF